MASYSLKSGATCALIVSKLDQRAKSVKRGKLKRLICYCFFYREPKSQDCETWGLKLQLNLYYIIPNVPHLSSSISSSLFSSLTSSSISSTLTPNYSSLLVTLSCSWGMVWALVRTFMLYGAQARWVLICHIRHAKLFIL